MTELLTATTIGGIASGGIIAASAITGETSVPLAEAISVFVFASSIVWWMGRKIQKLDDNQKKVEEKISEIKSQYEKGHAELVVFIKRLPCHPMSAQCPNPSAMKIALLDGLKKLTEQLYKEETTTT